MANFNLAELFMDTVYADIIFVVDKKEIPGHRLVLAKSCDYFDKLLFGDFMESKSKKVEISGISAKVFREVLRFIYKGQLEINEWSIEDLMSLLAVAHEYQLQPLFSAVINAVKRQPVDMDSWPLVSSAASVYDSQDLRRICYSFAEEKIEDFIREKDLETFPAALICCMFKCPKMSRLNQDQVVKAICKWKKGRSSSDIMSVMQKICWEKVSPKLTAIVLREFFSTVKNIEEYSFWTKLSADVDEPLESNAFKIETPLNVAPSAPLLEEEEALTCIARVDSVVLTKDVEMKFPLLNKAEGSLLCHLESGRLVFMFKKDESFVEIAVKRIEFDASAKFNIEEVWRWNLKGFRRKMVMPENSANNAWFKCNTVFTEAIPTNCIWIDSQHFKNISKIRLINIVIY